YNPEDLLLSSISACHMLWYLHLAGDAGIQVQAYTDTPLGCGEVRANGAGRFLSATLRPVITLAPGNDWSAANDIHGRIHEFCFIARSLNFPVSVDATYEWAVPGG
ncbi:MAG: OsmC family peroxiredoxin, partial [Granulosicoccus sp.]|nr:OsmC family peroxiredoxin [Granulosicoccus sp.]